MMQMTSTLKKEEGSIVIAALLILVLLTVVGFSATNNSNTELSIASNAQLHKMAFFTAESGWIVMADWLDDQYPLPTVNLGSDNTNGTDGEDDDGDGDTDEYDENIIDFSSGKWNQGGDLFPLSEGNSNYQYRVTAQFDGASIAAGWDPTEFLRFSYEISSTANIPARKGNAASQINVTAGKIEQIGS